MTVETATSRILCFSRDPEHSRSVVERLSPEYDVICPGTLEDSLETLHKGGFSGLFLCGDEMTSAGLLLQAGGILEQLNDGLALVGHHREILWHNRQFLDLSRRTVDSLTGDSFYDAFGSPEILGPDFCPLNTAFGTGESACSTLRVGDKTYYEVEATPVFDSEGDHSEFARYLIVVLRDTSTQVLQKQKLNAIYQAGLELGDLTPSELLEMSVDDRIELLKSKILHFTQDLLQYDTVEIRLLQRDTRQLDPLLSVGMDGSASQRELFANPTHNGVTGFVGATGKSYLCEDTTSDPLYLAGAADARSSLTVPLMLHDEVFGTFNVESPRPGAFSENDLQFLELFSREIAVALNTLDLLAVEKLSTLTQSTELVLREIAEPVDKIIQDATWLIENTVGADRSVTERLRDILNHTRHVRQLVHNVGDSILPDVGHAHAALPQSETRPRMQQKRVLVVDAEDNVRRSAHELLGRFGCEVETAHNAEECFLLCRSYHYDAVIADIRLPDRTGHEVFTQLLQIDPHLPVMLMTGYGYDPGHSIVKARQAGCKTILFKPFRIDQLVEGLDLAFACPSDLDDSPGQNESQAGS